MLVDRIFNLLLRKYKFKLVSIPIYFYNINTPTTLLINYLSLHVGLNKVIITLIIAFLL